MRRIIPSPGLSLLLLLTWILAFQAVDLGTILLGLLLAIVIPRITTPFWPDAPTNVRLGPLLRLTLLVIRDIVIANVRVALLIVGPARRLRPRFLVVPVDLRQPFAITLFANIISLTPGTVSSNLSGDRRSLLVHGLDVDDPEAAIADMKHRYERPLREVFE